MQKHSKIITAISLASLLCAASAHADDRVVREYSFDLGDINEVEFTGSVGSMEFVQTDGDELKIVLVIEGNDEGFFGGNRDVDDIELESKTRDDRLELELTEEDTTTEWTVQLPAVAVTHIKLGVGEIEGQFGATKLEVELGVGDADVEIPAAAAGDIRVEVGVGEAALRGANDKRSDGAMMFRDMRGKGEGDKDVKVEVGVGEASVTLN